MLARYQRWLFEHNKEESVVSLHTWILQEADFQIIASEKVRGVMGKLSDAPTRSTPRRDSQRTFFGEAKGDRKSQISRCLVCEKQHGVWVCPEFIQKSIQGRWSTAKRLQMCYRCLAQGHLGKSCPRGRICGQDGCTDNHHKLLHRPGPEKPQRSSDNTEVKCIADQDVTEDQATGTTEGKVQTEQTTMMTQRYVNTDFIGLRTVPVVLQNGNRSLTIHALLDDASTKTYVNADVAAELALQGQTERVTVNVLNGQAETFETRPVNVEVKSVSGNVSMVVNAYTVNRVTGNMPVVDWNKFKKQWPHLKNIEFPSSPKKPIVDMLIGLDCADLLYAIEEVRGRPGEPIARLTPLGWTCIGNPDSEHQKVIHTNFAYTYFMKDQSEIEKINSTLKQFWEIENVTSPDETPMVRIEDQLAMKQVEMSLTYDNQMYRVGIPWVKNKPVLPDNYEMALSRLENTEKRLKRSPEVAQSYSQCIDQYIEKGYVKRIQENDLSSSKWYLPHFPILRPDKDTTKTRIVFDASAKYNGRSLNDIIYQGPKLQQDLFDVLLRFRRLPVAVVCDIAEMYQRIGITPEDKPFHRFLWRGTDACRQPDVFEFDRVVFGVNSSPFLAQFVFQQHAKRFMDEFPMAAETILKATYMDDSMDSVLDENEGVELHSQLSLLLSKAGMHARKWLSNCSKVLGEIPIQDRKAEVDLDREYLPFAKTLGVWWFADQDVFTFKENAPGDMKYTKRNFLRKIATLFDPIGFLAPFTIRAKVLLQEMWAAGLDWDEEMDEPLAGSARDWFSELTDLTALRIPRCLLVKGKQIDTVSLYTFADASEVAYGAVVYARYCYQDGSISTNIVAAKTRVAPSKATSIPRLELMGAVTGVHLSTRIIKVLELQASQSTFWSDSLNVLWWIRGHSRDFKPFVANRVDEIQTYTSPEQWKYVPTDLNPADILSRGIKAAEQVECERWWGGPEFLHQSETAWSSRNLHDRHTGYDEMKGSIRLKKEHSRLQETIDNSSTSTFVAVTDENIRLPLNQVTIQAGCDLREFWHGSIVLWATAANAEKTEHPGNCLEMN